MRMLNIYKGFADNDMYLSAKVVFYYHNGISYCYNKVNIQRKSMFFLKKISKRDMFRLFMMHQIQRFINESSIAYNNKNKHIAINSMFRSLEEEKSI